LTTASKSGNTAAKAPEFPIFPIESAGKLPASQETPAMDRIPDSGTTKDIRNLVKSVFIPALPKDSRARQIAEEAHDPASADSFLRGKAEFDRAAAALKLLPDSSEGGKIRFRLAGQETLTQAGMVVALWQKAAEDRTTIFSGTGALGSTILVVQVDGVDLDTLWKDDEFGEALKANGNAGASVRVFETRPALSLPKQPDPDNGVIITSYIGSMLMAGGFLAIGSAVSAATRSQVIAFIITVVICFALLLAGHPLVLSFAKMVLPQWLVDGVAALSFITHFTSISKGVIDLRDLIFFGLLIGFFLYATSVVIDLKKAD